MMKQKTPGYIYRILKNSSIYDYTTWYILSIRLSWARYISNGSPSTRTRGHASIFLNTNWSNLMLEKLLTLVTSPDDRNKGGLLKSWMMKYGNTILHIISCKHAHALTLYSHNYKYNYHGSTLTLYSHNYNCIMEAHCLSTLIIITVSWKRTDSLLS